EPGKRFGIILSVERVEEQAAAMGFDPENLGEREKALAREALILKDSAVTAGIFASESDNLAGSMKILQATLNDLMVELGEFFLPYATKGVQILRDLVQWVSSLDKPTKTLAMTIGAVAAAIGPFLLGLSRVISAVKAVRLAFGALLGPVGLVIAAIGLLYAAYQNNFMGFADGVHAALDRVKEAFGG